MLLLLLLYAAAAAATPWLLLLLLLLLLESSVPAPNHGRHSRCWGSPGSGRLRGMHGALGSKVEGTPEALDSASP